MRDLLLEIGTEEIPAGIMNGILAQLAEKAQKELADLRLSAGDVRAIGTPRRLALIVKDLAEEQTSVERQARGPAVAIAYKDGQPTKAAQGFARGQHVSPEELVVKDGYVYALVKEEGKPAAELLRELLPRLITELSFPNNMRWGSLDFKFIRPLRWLVAMFGSEVIPFTVAKVTSGKTSRGHRFLSQGEFDIADAADYEAALAKNFVIADQDKRREMIREQLTALARERGGEAEISPGLLEEVTYLVEYPTALCGRFEEKYLSLPPAAVITPMRDHQRYFPVKDSEGKLLPLFLTVRNGGQEHLETVQHGNERVLRARLADAQFFFDEDRKKPLIAHRERLKTVVFQEGLGSVYEKTERLEGLVEKLTDWLDSPEVREVAKRAAILSKADLVTGMVTEFTELQGVMGCEYARLDGEPEDVAVAIDEHYRPRFAGDSQPQTLAGRLLSLADKIDNIVATFSRGLVPTGSQDPFALRRQALGMVRTIIEMQAHLSLTALTEAALDALGITDSGQRAKITGEVADFLRLRLKNVLEEAGLRYDCIDAVIVDMDDIFAAYERGQAVAEFVAGSEANRHIQSFLRVGNLAKKAVPGATLDPGALQDPAEKALYAAWEKVAGTGDYRERLASLATLSQPIDAFFDAVMVMDENLAVRNNRLALLTAINDKLSAVADFTKIVM